MNKNFFKTYSKNVLPAIITAVVLGTFSIVDGLFIGNKIGDIGLGAINYAYPITALIQSIGFGIGMGSAVLISIARGKNDFDKIKKILFNTYILFFVVAVILMAIFMPLAHPILNVFGAKEEEMHNVAYAYLNAILFAALPQILSQGLVPILRNFGKNIYVMIIMSLSFITNIFLDWLFIYPLDLGLMGAALATNIAQTITTLGCIIILVRKEYRPTFIFDKKLIKSSLLVGISPFGIMFVPSIVLILINKSCSIFNGDTAVAAYTAISYVTFMVTRLITGVGDGAQPLMSEYYGRGDKKNLIKTLRYSLVLAISIGLIMTLLIIIFNDPISHIFGISDDAIVLYKESSLYFVLPFSSLAVMKIAMSYFYSQKKNMYAYIIVYLEPIIVLLFVFILPIFLKTSGIWLSQTLAQTIPFIPAVILINKLNRNLKQDKNTMD